MVAREELLEDLFHLLRGTHWPSDKSGSTLARNGANRVPKPPRTPALPPHNHHTGAASTASLHGSKANLPPLNPPLGTPQLPVPSKGGGVNGGLCGADRRKSSEDEDNSSVEGGSTSCFDWDTLISSLDPNYSIEVQSQYNQVSADPPSATFTPVRRKFSASGGKKSASSSNWSMAHSLASIRQSALALSSTTTPLTSPVHECGQSKTALHRTYSSKTQQVILLLLCEVFDITEEEKEKFFTAAELRRSAVVNVDVSLTTTGHDPSIHGALKVLGGSSTHAQELSPPLPATFSITFSLENMYNQQLLVRFSRNRTVLLENAKSSRKLKLKKKKKDVTTEAIELTPLRKTASDVAPLRPSEISASVTTDHGTSSHQPLRTTDALLHYQQHPLDDSSTALPSTDSKKMLGSKTLHRGLKGIRQSFKKKKKKNKDGVEVEEEDDDDGGVEDSVDGGRDVGETHLHLKGPTGMDSPLLDHHRAVAPSGGSNLFAQGIKSHDVSTPIKPGRPPIITTAAAPPVKEKSSKSPFRRFGSLRKAEASLMRFTKRGGSMRQKDNTEVLEEADESQLPVKIKRAELITRSKPELERTIEELERANPFDCSEEELDESNPFHVRNDSVATDDTINHYYTANNTLSGSNAHVNDSISEVSIKKKGFRRSVRKTFSRIGSIKKGKKVSSEISAMGENLPLKPHDSSVPHTHLTKAEQLHNKRNTAESHLTIDGADMNTSDLSHAGAPPPIPPKKSNKPDSPPKTKIVTDELAYKMIQLQDAATQSVLENFQLGYQGLKVQVDVRLSITFDTKCSAFDLYRKTFESLYKKRFQEMIPTKLPLEGVDCNATVDGELLLKQITIFSPMSPLRVALARYLVLVDAATGKMGTANTIHALQKKKLEESITVAAVHEILQPDDDKKESSPVFSKVTSPAKSSPTQDKGIPYRSGKRTPRSSAGSSRHSAASSEDGYIYNQKAETIYINPGDLFTLLVRVEEGLKSNLYSMYETNQALGSSVMLCRWMIGHHLERLQTVFPVGGTETSCRQLADTLKCMALMESCDFIRDRFASETSELCLGGLRDHAIGAVRKYTQLWVSALLKETTYRIDLAMTDQLPPAQVGAAATAATTSSPVASATSSNRAATLPATAQYAGSSASSTSGGAPAPPAPGGGGLKSLLANTEMFSDEGLKLPFNAADVTEAVPALLSSFVRTVKQFENNKQIVYIADMVEKKCLGTSYRTQLQTGTLGATVPMPMLTHHTSFAGSTPDEDEISEMVLRLKVVGELMPVIVDFLDVAKHFYDPIFKEHFQLRFLHESWQELVDGALALWRQIGSTCLREGLVNPPLPAPLLPQAISAVWALCSSFSAINKLGSSLTGTASHRTELYCECMDDSVMCWLRLIQQSAGLQLKRDLQQVSKVSEGSQLDEWTRDSRNLVALVVDKVEKLVWLNGAIPQDVLTCLADQLVQYLDNFWQTLYSKHKATGTRPNVITYWSCRILDCLTELRDEVSEALERIDNKRGVVSVHLTVLNLMPHKTAQNMCYEELKDVDTWMCTAAAGGGGGALVQRLDEALHELYDCLAPAQPLVACVRDRLQDAATKCLEETTQEEDFNQLAAVLEALQQFFTNNILLEESLRTAECRWEELVSIAHERGRPLADLQHRYYCQRYAEQQEQLIEDQTATSSMLVNVVFVEGIGLCVSVVQAPSALSIVKAAQQQQTLNNNSTSSTGSSQLSSALSKITTSVGGSSKPAPATSKTTGMFSNMFKGATGPGGVYVKAQVVPAEWFPAAPVELKTSLCKEDPAVIDEEMVFPKLFPSCQGVQNGGFLLLRLKLSRRLRSQVVSEALIPLSSTPFVSPENRRALRHTQLPLTKALPLHSYEALTILKRRDDERTMQFLAQLENDNKGQQKALLRGSNTSLSSMW